MIIGVFSRVNQHVNGNTGLLYKTIFPRTFDQYTSPLHRRSSYRNIVTLTLRDVIIIIINIIVIIFIFIVIVLPSLVTLPEYAHPPTPFLRTI